MHQCFELIIRQFAGFSGLSDRPTRGVGVPVASYAMKAGDLQPITR